MAGFLEGLWNSVQQYTDKMQRVENYKNLYRSWSDAELIEEEHGIYSARNRARYGDECRYRSEALYTLLQERGYEQPFFSGTTYPYGWSKKR